MTRQAIVSKAREYVNAGTKWRHRGRDIYGIDCVGIVVNSLKAANIDVIDRLDYGREPWKDGLRQELAKQFGPIIGEVKWRPGDIALFKWFHTEEPTHVGILGDYKYGGLSIIHAHSTFNVTEHHLVGPWRRILVEVYSCRL